MKSVSQIGMRNSAEQKKKRVPIIMKFDRDKLLDQGLMGDKQGSLSFSSKHKKFVTCKPEKIKGYVQTENSPYRQKAEFTNMSHKKSSKH